MDKHAMRLCLTLALMFTIYEGYASDPAPRKARNCYVLVADALNISSQWERGVKRLEVQNAISPGLDRPSREQLEMLVVEGYERLERGTAAVDWVDSVEKRCLSGELSAPLPAGGAV
jgi:hypothetical protein